MSLNTNIKQDHELNFVALVGGAPAEVRGKRTMPSWRLDDPDSKYLPACKTDIRQTWIAHGWQSRF